MATRYSNLAPGLVKAAIIPALSAAVTMPISGSGGGGFRDVRHEHRTTVGDVEQRDAALVVQLRGDQRAVTVHTLARDR